ncbi:MAG: pilus assembly protein PilM [Thermodesulfobacteriota bacterium]
MLQALKALFSPKSVVGLQVHGSFLAAVQVSNPSYAPVIERVAYKEVENPEEMPREVEAFLETEGFNPEVLVTSVPSSQATIREIQMDFQNSRKLHEIVKYQMEPHVPHPIEDMVVDYFPPEPEGLVLTFGLQKAVLSGHLAFLSSAGLTPQVVSLEDVALSSILAKTRPDMGEQPVAILHVTGERRVLQVVSNKRMRFIRALPAGPDPSAQLKETLNLYRLKDPRPVTEILITGRAAAVDGLADAVRAETGIQTSPWRPFDQIRREMGDMSPDLQARTSVPLGLALGMVNGGSKRFNLRKEEFTFRESLRLKSLLIYMVSALVLLLGLSTFDLYHKVSVRQEAYEALNRRIRQIYLQTFPGTTNLVRGREAVQMQQRLSSETAQYRWLEETAAGGSVLDVLMAVTRKVGGYKDVSLDNFAVEGGKINLDGRASSFQNVDNLKGRLGEGGAFKNVKLLSAKMDSRDQVVLFNFVLERAK